MRSALRTTPLLSMTIAGLLLAALPAQARNIPASELPSDLRFKREVTSAGPLAKMLFLPGGTTYALGGGGVQYFGDHAYFGGRGWGGLIGGNGGMGFGGVVFGGEGTLGPALFRAELALGGGGGGGGNTPSGGFMGAEPSLAIGLDLPEGAQFDVTAGYLFASNAGFSGPTVGLRFSFKTVTYHADMPADQDPLSR